jgi:hypothetical protein
MNGQRRYAAVRSLVQELGGAMIWYPTRAGGDWVLSLRGRTATIPCRNNRINDLDALYVARVRHPKSWDDYDEDAPLAPDAFWALVRADFWRPVRERNASDELPARRQP